MLQLPFRKDTQQGWLGKKRITEILTARSFICHKTSDPDKESLQCVGHMHLLQDKNIFYRVLKATEIPIELKGRELIFDNIDDCINHHSSDEY